jgi:hypothetical protein
VFDCRAVSGFARAVKNISGGKSFTFAYNGYLFDLSDSRLTGSGHLDLSSLLQDANLDGIGSPYQYASAPREPAGRFTSHGPVDSATLHKKVRAFVSFLVFSLSVSYTIDIPRQARNEHFKRVGNAPKRGVISVCQVWVTEDDTRTVLTDKGSFDRHVSTVEGTVNIIRRNMCLLRLSTSIGKSGLVAPFSLNVRAETSRILYGAGTRVCCTGMRCTGSTSTRLAGGGVTTTRQWLLRRMRCGATPVMSSLNGRSF